MVLGLVTHPLLTAFPGQLDPPREGAVRAGQANVHAAQGHAAHRPVQASALVLAAALEGLSAAVHRATEDAGSTIFGGAHADLAVGRGAEVAEEALVRVAGSRSVHSSPSCLAQTRQQPQPSSTRLTPAGQRGACSAGHRHGPLQFWPTAGRLQKARKSTKATRTGPTPAAVMVGAAGGTEGAVAASG